MGPVNKNQKKKNIQILILEYAKLHFKKKKKMIRLLCILKEAAR